jgi:hypothetical protein
MTVDETGKEGLPLSVIDLSSGKPLENGVGGTDGGDPVPLDGERDIVLHRIGVHHGRMSEDDSPVRARLGLGTARIEKESGSAGPGPGQQLPPGEVDRAIEGLRRRRRAIFSGVWHSAKYIIDPHGASQEEPAPL